MLTKHDNYDLVAPPGADIETLTGTSLVVVYHSIAHSYT